MLSISGPQQMRLHNIFSSSTIQETARTLLFHHPDSINVDVTATHTIKNYMLNDPMISDMIETLAAKMRDMGPPTETSARET